MTSTAPQQRERLLRIGEVVRRGASGLQIEDLGSLNGTYLNRKRIEAAAGLSDGDELQIGKYRLAFLT